MPLTRSLSLYSTTSLLTRVEELYLPNIAYRRHTRFQATENAYISSRLVTTAKSRDHLRATMLQAARSPGPVAPGSLFLVLRYPAVFLDIITAASPDAISVIISAYVRR